VVAALWAPALALSQDPSEKVQPLGLRALSLVLAATAGAPAGAGGAGGADLARAAEAVRQGLASPSPKTAVNACHAAVHLFQHACRGGGADGAGGAPWRQGVGEALRETMDAGRVPKARVFAASALRVALASLEGDPGAPRGWVAGAWRALCRVLREEGAGGAGDAAREAAAALAVEVSPGDPALALARVAARVEECGDAPVAA